MHSQRRPPLNTQSGKVTSEVPVSESVAGKLTGLYVLWRDCTIRQKQFILLDDWVQVATCQKKKEKFKEEISRITDPESPECHEVHNSDFVHELVLAETDLVELISERLERTRRDIENLESSSRSLKHIHKTYAPRTPQSGFSNAG